MRILTVCSDLGLGGTQRVAVNLTLAYRELGHDVALLAYGGDGPRAGALAAAGVPTFIGRDGPTLNRAHAFAADAIHLHRPGMGSPLHADLLGRLKRPGAPVVETNVFARCDYLSPDLIDVHFQLSRWCMWRWRRSLGRARSRTAGVIVPNGLDTARFTPVNADTRQQFRARHAIPADAYLCGRVGSPIGAKWHPSTLTSFEHLARVNPDAYLVLVGLPPDYRRLLDALAAPVRNRVRVLDPIENDAGLRELYGSLDCFVHAAQIGESFGLVLVEAMLCGCPVVTVARPTRDNSQAEVVGHGVGGVVAASFDDLPGAVELLWRDQDLRQRLRTNLAARTSERFERLAVARLALRAIEHAVRSAGDRNRLLKWLASDSTLVCDVPDSEIRALARNVYGRRRGTDLLLARLLCSRPVQRAINMRFRRRMGHLLENQRLDSDLNAAATA